MAHSLPDAKCPEIVGAMLAMFERAEGLEQDAAAAPAPTTARL
jgi:hypothetical protein